MKKRLIYIGLLILLSFISVAYAENIVISEVLYYPVGAESKEWIELYNPTDNAIDIGGWKIYSFFDTSPDLTIPSGKIIQPHGYFLIGDLGWDESWPKADYNARLWLTNVNAGVKLTDNNDITIDALGWGTSSQILYGYYEGEAHSLVAQGHSLERILTPDCNVQDTNNNAVDFIDNAQLSPRNSNYKCGESICGDNIIEGSEVCDGSNLNSKTCVLLGYDYGNLICLSNCSGYDTRNCRDYVCGNNIKEPGEECDDGNLINEDGCSSLCIIEHLPFCGDNIVNNGEICDGSDLNSKTCVDFGYSNPNTLLCNANCLGFNTTRCSAVCGNNVKETGEECDDGNLVDRDGCSKDCRSEIMDDLEINYLRGKIAIEGIVAQEGTHYKIEVLLGDNIGSVYESTIDEDIPSFLKENGLFDTRDRVIFTTGSAFRITSNYCEGNYEGQFLNGGNGDFLDENSIVKFDCFVRPIINNVYNSPTQPTELDNISIFADVTDNIGVDKVFVNYNVNNAGIESKEMDFNIVYSASLGIFNKRDVIDYAIMAKDVNGNEVWSDGFLITVEAGDRDGDGYTSDDDCDDNNNLINPAATESCNGLDDDCDNNIDEEDATGCSIYNKDFDIDGYGSNDTKCLCSAVYPYNVTLNDDCDDNDSLVNPAAIESRNGLDDDCDGKIDEGYIDTDGDNVIDEEDACPTTYGKWCNGCPEPECVKCTYPYCSESGIPYCKNSSYNTQCDDEYKCSLGLGDNNYAIGGDYLCAGYCDGQGSCDYANKCYYTDVCDTDYDKTQDYINLNRFPKPFVKFGKFNGSIILGDKSSSYDVLAATEIGVILQYSMQNSLSYLLTNGSIKNITSYIKIPTGNIILASEFNNINDNLIIIGEPCSNSLLFTYLNITGEMCDNFILDKSIIKLFNSNDRAVLLVIGYTPINTLQAAMVLADYEESNLQGDELVIIMSGIMKPTCNNDYHCDLNETFFSCPTDCIYSDEDVDGYNSLIDCNDTNASIYPGSIELCNGVDDNCNNQIDEGYSDLDKDGIMDCADNDNDNDGINDAEDAYPLDPDRSILGDVSGDDKVDITDLMMVRGEFGKISSDSEWKPYYDVNGDGKISLADLIKIRRSFT